MTCAWCPASFPTLAERDEHQQGCDGWPFETIEWMGRGGR